MPFGLSLPELKSAPVPPSLVASPFLTSPVFNCPSEAPHIITEQDNLWLQDTVPVPMRTSSPSQNGSLKHGSSLRHVHSLRSRPAAAPSSPPIVISSSREPRRCASSQSLSAYPLNHPSNFHLTPNHRRALSLHPPSSSSSSSARGRHIRMRSDCDLDFAAKTSGETCETAAVSSFC